jgi:xylose dehydrogenase (NAD/NADP)
MAVTDGDGLSDHGIPDASAPDARSHDPVPHDVEPLRWGVLGATSTVARLAVLPALAASPTARVTALASRSAGRSELAAFGPARCTRSYEELLADPEVEAVYLPLPNQLHRRYTELAAAAGKHVLCEKPLAPTAADAAAMADACARAGVVLMEAYMTAFHPRTRVVERLLADGAVGQLRHAEAAFCFPLRRPDDHRWLPDGGGALLDVGIYCLTPMLQAAGRPPRRTAAAARLAPTGVDATLHALLDFGDGTAATALCSFELPERQHLELVGTEAVLSVPHPFTPGPSDRRVVLTDLKGQTRLVETGSADPYRLMIEHFAAVVRGRQALCRPPEVSVGLARLLDELAAEARRGGENEARRGGENEARRGGENEARRGGENEARRGGEK